MASSNPSPPRGSEAARVPHSAGRLRVVWLGGASGGLAWLQQRLQAYRSPRAEELQLSIEGELSMERVRWACEAGAERIILACSRRLDYPFREIDWITTHCPEIPFALATNSWWEGARRTGLGGLPHVAMPWHRWWDGWVDWLDAASAELFGPCVLPPTYHVEATRQRPAAGSSGVARRASTALGQGWIIADCWQTAQAWSLAAEQMGAAVQVQTSAGFGERRGGDELTEHASTTKVDWLVWDDSCLTTAGGAPELGQCQAAVEWARRTQEHARICCAFSMPRWHVWESLQRSGADELLTKPNTGRGLQRMLEAWQVQEQPASRWPAESATG